LGGGKYMHIYRLRLKLGENELEAEGPQDYVEKQRDISFAKIQAKEATELEGETTKVENREQQTLDLGNGNTVVAPASHLHATWKI
jgi:hypothetical protein